MGIDIGATGFSHLSAAADYRTNIYHLAAIDSSGTVTLNATLGARVDGVIYNKPNSSEAVDMRCFGVVKVRYGGTVTRGDKLVAAASGEAVTQTLRSQYVIGIALASGANDEVHQMLVTHEGEKYPSVIPIPINLASITAAGDVLTNYTPGFAGRIVKVDFAVSVPVTTGSKAASLNVEIGTTNLTGGVVALTSANCTPLGAVVAGSAVTAANTFSATDTVSVEAASVTAFSEGAGYLLLVLD